MFVGEHLGSNVLHNLKLVKYVSNSTFSIIKDLFPNAIVLPVHFVGGGVEPCKKCTQKKQMEVEFPGKMLSLVERHSALFEPRISSNVNGKFRVLTKGTFDDVCKMAEIIKAKCPPKEGRERSTGQAIKSKLIKLFFNDNESSELASEMDKQARMTLSKQNLICEHAMTLISSNSIISAWRKSMDAKNDHIENIIILKPEAESEQVEIIPEATFELYISFITSLQCLLNDTCEDTGINDFQTYVDNKFPTMTMNCEDVSINPQSCICGCVVDEMLNSNVPVSIDDTLPISSKSQEMNFLEKNFNEEVRIIEVQGDEKKDDEAHFGYKVYQFDQKYTLPKITSLLEKRHCDKENDSHVDNINASRRRSTRIRNSTPWSLYTFEGKQSDTLAHVRLRINELLNFTTDLSDQNLALFKLQDDAIGECIVCELSHDSDAKEMIEVLDMVKNDPVIEIILYSKLFEERGRNKNKNDSAESNEELMDKLLFIATTDNESYCPKAKKKRTEERGFQGTFLQSNPSNIIHDVN